MTDTKIKTLERAIAESPSDMDLGVKLFREYHKVFDKDAIKELMKKELYSKRRHVKYLMDSKTYEPFHLTGKSFPLDDSFYIELGLPGSVTLHATHERDIEIGHGEPCEFKFITRCKKNRKEDCKPPLFHKRLIVKDTLGLLKKIHKKPIYVVGEILTPFDDQLCYWEGLIKRPEFDPLIKLRPAKSPSVYFSHYVYSRSAKEDYLSSIKSTVEKCYKDWDGVLADL